MIIIHYFIYSRFVHTKYTKRHSIPYKVHPPTLLFPPKESHLIYLQTLNDWITGKLAGACITYIHSSMCGASSVLFSISAARAPPWKRKNIYQCREIIALH